MLNSLFNARGQYRRSARLLTFVLLISCAWSCKSWGKFWAIYTPGEARPLYAGAPLWNDYIAADGTALTVRGVSANAPSGVSSRLNASGTACNSAATGGYGVCIHAGLMRQSVINDKEDCSGISASDALGAFIWVCDASVKPVRLIAVGFNEGKYMTDLMDFDAVAFRPNSLTVTVDGVSYTSPSTVWWANPVSNFSATLYGSTSAVVLIQSNPNSAAIITNNADKTALLMRPGVKITTTSASAVLNNAGKNFSWFEGVIDINGAGAGAIGFALSGGRFDVVANFSIQNANGTANTSYQVNGSNAYFRDVRYANATIANQKSMDILATSDGNLFSGVTLTNDEKPILLNGTNNQFIGLTVANQTAAANNFVELGTTAIGNVILNYTHANNGIATNGTFRLNGSGNAFSTFMNMGFANILGGPIFSIATAQEYSQFINFGLHETTGGANTVINPTANSNNYFSGVFKVSNADCNIFAANTGLIAGCGLQNASDFNLVVGLDVTSSFVGKVLVDDPQNSSDTSGLTTYSTGMDWVKFSNRFRGYGKDGSSFPNSDNRGRCTAADCRIWDWSLKATDTQLRNVLSVPTGNNVATQKWTGACTQLGAVSYATNTCNYPPFPGSAGQCNATTWPTPTPAISFATAACLTTFLRNAYEIIGDGIGNENGLCESNEACIYTPNIASYQGHGNLTCIRGPAEYGCPSAFSDGTISGVVLYQYANNGY